MTLLSVVLFCGCGFLPTIPNNPRYHNVYEPPYMPAPAQQIDTTQINIGPPDVEVHLQQEKVEQERILAADREATLTYARRHGVCGKLDDEHCYYLASKIGEACGLLDSIKEGKADVAYQWREARKYGVIDLDEVESAKEHVEGQEDSLAEAKKDIRSVRGKNFTSADCKATVE